MKIPSKTALNQQKSKENMFLLLQSTSIYKNFIIYISQHSMIHHLTMYRGRYI